MYATPTDLVRKAVVCLNILISNLCGCEAIEWLIMKLKYRFEIIEIEDEYKAVPIDDTCPCGILSMNGSAVEIFKLLRKETEINVIIEDLIKRYPNESEEIIRQFVEKTLDILKKAELILA